LGIAADSATPRHPGERKIWDRRRERPATLEETRVVAAKLNDGWLAIWRTLKVTFGAKSLSVDSLKGGVQGVLRLRESFLKGSCRGLDWQMKAIKALANDLRRLSVGLQPVPDSPMKVWRYLFGRYAVRSPDIAGQLSGFARMLPSPLPWSADGPAFAALDRLSTPGESSPEVRAEFRAFVQGIYRALGLYSNPPTMAVRLPTGASLECTGQQGGAAQEIVHLLSSFRYTSPTFAAQCISGLAASVNYTLVRRGGRLPAKLLCIGEQGWKWRMPTMSNASAVGLSATVRSVAQQLLTRDPTYTGVDDGTDENLSQFFAHLEVSKGHHIRSADLEAATDWLHQDLAAIAVEELLVPYPMSDSVKRAIMATVGPMAISYGDRTVNTNGRGLLMGMSLAWFHLCLVNSFAATRAIVGSAVRAGTGDPVFRDRHRRLLKEAELADKAFVEYKSNAFKVPQSIAELLTAGHGRWTEQAIRVFPHLTDWLGPRPGAGLLEDMLRHWRELGEMLLTDVEAADNRLRDFERTLDCYPSPSSAVWASAARVARSRVRIVGDDLFAVFSGSESAVYTETVQQCGGRIQTKKDFCVRVGGVRPAGGVFLERLYTTQPQESFKVVSSPGTAQSRVYRVLPTNTVRMSALMGDAPAALSAGELVRFALEGVTGQRRVDAIAVAMDIHRHHLKTLNKAALPLFGPTWLPGGGFPHPRGDDYAVRRLPRLYRAAIVYGAAKLPTMCGSEWVGYQDFRDFWSDTRAATTALVGGTTFRAMRRVKRRIDSSDPKWFGFDVGYLNDAGDRKFPRTYESRIITVSRTAEDGSTVLETDASKYQRVDRLVARLVADTSRLEWLERGKVDVSITRSRPTTKVACEARRALARHAARYRVSRNVMMGKTTIDKPALARIVGLAFKAFVVNPDHFPLNSLQVRGTPAQPSRRREGDLAENHRGSAR